MKFTRRSHVATVVHGLVGGGALLALGAVPAHAQTQADIDGLRAQIQALQSRLDQLEAQEKEHLARPTAGSSTPPTTASKSKLPVEVSGLLQVQGNGYFNETNLGKDPKDADSFRLRRAQIQLTGQISDRVSGTVMVDPAKTLKNYMPVGSATTVPLQANNILQDVELDYQLRQAASDPSRLRVGQYKIPIGYEGDLVATDDEQMTERALMFRARDPFQGGYGDIRDTGVTLEGGIPQFSYDVGVFNGLGDHQNTIANSDAKALLGRLIYKPRPVPGLQLGVSGGHADTASLTGGPNFSRSLLNGFVAYNKGKWRTQAEYLTGNSVQIPGAALLSDINSYYVGTGYRFNKRIEGVLRYDTFDFDRHISGAQIKEESIGVNYYLDGVHAKIYTDLVRALGAADAPAGVTPYYYENKGTQVRTQFQVSF